MFVLEEKYHDSQSQYQIQVKTNYSVGFLKVNNIYNWRIYRALLTLHSGSEYWELKLQAYQEQWHQMKIEWAQFSIISDRVRNKRWNIKWIKNYLIHRENKYK